MGKILIKSRNKGADPEFLIMMAKPLPTHFLLLLLLTFLPVSRIHFVFINIIIIIFFLFLFFLLSFFSFSSLLFPLQMEVEEVVLFDKHAKTSAMNFFFLKIE